MSQIPALGANQIPGRDLTEPIRREGNLEKEGVKEGGGISNQLTREFKRREFDRLKCYLKCRFALLNPSFR